MERHRKPEPPLPAHIQQAATKHYMSASGRTYAQIGALLYCADLSQPTTMQSATDLDGPLVAI
jgi:hypothetical protein